MSSEKVWHDYCDQYFSHGDIVMIFHSHRRLRRDYEEELRKAKNAVTEQATHFETIKNKMKQAEEVSSAKLKQATEEHNEKVSCCLYTVSSLLFY